MKKLKNNKGVAFVTVLISITFISILAVSLLYIAYLNYLTKTLRTQSTNNFYTGEFGVDEVAASLQQTAATAKSKSGGKGGISDAKKAIATAVGSSVTGDTGSGTYDPAKVTGLVQVVNSDPNTTVVVTSSDPVYIAKAYSVELKNLRFDTTDSSGYTSTIYTDMTVQFQSTPPGDFDINDFSVISDSIIAIDGGASGSGSVDYAGCIYVKDSEGLGYALKNDKGMLVSLLCPVGIIDGDLIITNSPSAVSIAGNVMVRGDVKIDPGCSLAVSGSLKVSGDVINKGNIVGSTHIKKGVDLSAIPKEGLAGAVFAKHLYAFRYENVGGPGPVIYDYAEIPLSKITDGTGSVKKNLTFEEGGKTYTYPIVYFTKGGGNTKVAITEVKNPNYDKTTEKSEYYSAQLNMPDTKDNGENAALVLTHRNINYENPLRSVTMLTLGRIRAINDREVTMSKMSDEGFEAAKEALYIGNNSYNTKDKSSGQFDFTPPDDSGKLYTVGGDWRDFCEAMCSGDWVVYSYDVNGADSISKKPLIGVSTGAQKTKDIKNMEQTVYMTDEKGNILDVDGNIWNASSKKEKAIKISPDDATRYLVFQSDGGTTNSDWDNKSHVGKGNQKITIMVPYGYFLSSDTSVTVSKYISSSSTAENPDLTTVRYDNWYKE